jgi:hypothetical protein
MELPGTRNGAMRFFASCFVMNNLSSKALKNNDSAIEIFAKIRGYIRNSRCIAGGQLATSVVDIGGEH